MLKIAQRFEKDVMEVHKVFYEVSCDRANLVKVLNGEKDIP